MAGANLAFHGTTSCCNRRNEGVENCPKAVFRREHLFTEAIPILTCGSRGKTEILLSEYNGSVKRMSLTLTTSATWMVCPVNGLTANKMTDPRAMLALARVNWLHSRYDIVSTAQSLGSHGLVECIVKRRLSAYPLFFSP